MALSVRHWLLIIFVFVFDRVSKSLVDAFVIQPISVLSFVEIVFVKNTGIAFGFLNAFSLQWLFVFISLVVIIGLALYSKKDSVAVNLYGFSLIIGGALGNVFDRIFFGYVIDFISIGWWPAFNIADASLTIGVLLLIYSELRHN